MDQSGSPQKEKSKRIAPLCDLRMFPDVGCLYAKYIKKRDFIKIRLKRKEDWQNVKEMAEKDYATEILRYAEKQIEKINEKLKF